MDWRRGCESNTPRPAKRADDGFEDRGDHQAPITLREFDNKLLSVLASGNGVAFCRLKERRCRATAVQGVIHPLDEGW